MLDEAGICLRIDAGTPCVPTGSVETCNGRDDDCIAGADDGFACAQGASLACTTTCGSTGTGACANDCTLPTPTACIPPTETCNDADDDCDAIADEGVLAFGPPIAWPGTMAPVPTTTGYVGFLQTPTSIDAQRFDTSARPVGAAQTVLIGDYRAVDACPGGVGRSVLVAAIDGTNMISLVEISAETLTVVAGPRVIGSRTGGGYTQIQVANPAGIVVAYTSGSAIHVRTGSAVTLGSYAEGTAVTGVDGFALIDMLVPPGTLGRAAVAYEAVPPATGGDATTDSEVFVALVDGSGALVGTPHRLTTNAEVDRVPRLAGNGRELAITWLRSPLLAATARPRLAVVVPADAAPWTVLGESEIALDATFFVPPLAAPRPRGWAVFASEAGAGPMTGRLVMALASADARTIAPPAIASSTTAFAGPYAALYQGPSSPLFVLEGTGDGTDITGADVRAIACP
jgi:hypothetical protein